MVQEAFINGASTLKDGTSRPKLRDSNPSLPVKSCEITKDLSDQVEWFRTHPLEKEYPVIWVDALDEKVRCEKHVISMAVAVVQGITKEGNREILAVEPLIA